MSHLQRVFSEKRRLILPLVLVAIANVIAYAVVVYPLGRQVTADEQEQRQARDALRLARLDYQSARATITGKQQADASLKQFYSEVLPASASAAQRVTYLRLAQMARETNVKLQRGANEPKPEKDSSLEKLTTSYTLSGDYRDVRQFIYALETAPEFIVLENVTLSSDQQSRGLAVEIVVATYYRTADVH